MSRDVVVSKNRSVHSWLDVWSMLDMEKSGILGSHRLGRFIVFGYA